ncbi:hypothetical protein PsorP6_004487 [Peronosclerospora sorghi]|uniref:Uncharacterized protein n=1 Tax=Peronosclerospora sorghi TaxID=230839 RepID=A0ACC0VRR8_9STRA|nr:hypothetical protein PsorP6_004487 [Peronosclerospora sorghi]
MGQLTQIVAVKLIGPPFDNPPELPHFIASVKHSSTQSTSVMSSCWYITRLRCMNINVRHSDERILLILLHVAKYIKISAGYKKLSK